MRYSEKENFNRVVRWDHPSHVCWRPPSKGVVYHGAWPASVRPSPDATQWQDIWGVTWTDADGEVFPTGPAIPSIDALGDLEVPDSHAPERMAAARAHALEIDRDEFFLTVNHPYFLYEKGFNILGGEEFLAALAGSPDKAHEFLDLLAGFDLAMAEQYVELQPDHVNLSDDYGMQDRLAVSPTMWREFFKPRLKRVVDFYRDALGDEATISLHSCGHVMPILEDLIEIGFDVLHPIQTTANDLAEARRITSKRLTLCGCIDGQQVLPFGTPDDVRREVFSKLDLLWEDGGYLPGPEKMLGVSPANKEAMEHAFEDWSRQNVEAR
jgi:hypothetical protein